MAVPKTFSLARMTTATTGGGTITLGAAVAGFLSFAAAGIADGDLVSYGIKDGASSEYGYGTYTASGTTLTRTVRRSTNSNSPISLSGSAEVFILRGHAELFPNIASIQNASLSVTVSANALTIALKDEAGNDPSVNSPVWVPFRSSTATTGRPVWQAQESALSLTISSGSTLGAVANVAFRVWIVLFDDGGTLRLGAIQRVTGAASGSGLAPTAVAALADDIIASSTAEGGAGAADSAGVIYTGTAVSAKSLRILGYAEWSSGLATPGTWGSAPTAVHVQTPMSRSPGQVVQQVQATTGSETTTTSSTFQSTGLTANISPSAACNVIKSTVYGGLKVNANAVSSLAQIHRGSQALGGGPNICYTTAGGQTLAAAALHAFDVPNSTSATTYVVKLRNSDNTTTVGFPNQGGSILLEEIMA